jgi:hypothetical protein
MAAVARARGALPGCAAPSGLAVLTGAGPVVSRWSAAGAVPLAVVRVCAVQRAGYRRSAAGLGIFVASGIGAAALWAPPAEPFDGFRPALEAPGDVLLLAVVACLGLAVVRDAGDVDPDDGARAFAALEAEPWLVDAPILGGFALIGVGVVALLAGRRGRTRCALCRARSTRRCWSASPCCPFANSASVQNSRSHQQSPRERGTRCGDS